MSRRLPWLALSCLIAPSAVAQPSGTATLVKVHRELSTAWYTGLGMNEPAAFHRAVSGRFVHGFRKDVGALGDDALFLAQDVGTMGSLRHVADGVLSVDVIPTPLGSKDRLAITTATGLSVLDHDGSGFIETVIDTGVFAGSTSVCSGDLTGDGTTDLIAVAADGVTVKLAIGLSGGGFIAGPTVAIGAAPIHQLRAIEWDGEPRAEIAIATASTVEVWNDVALAFSAPTTSADSHIAALTDSSPNRLVWTAPGIGGEVLSVHDPVAGTTDVLALTGVDAAGLSAGDADDDGLDDVVIPRASTSEILVLRGHSGPDAPFGFDPEDYQTIAVEVDGDTSLTLTCAAVVDDLDRDGALDFCLPTVDSLSMWTLLAAPPVAPPLPARIELDQDAGVQHVLEARQSIQVPDPGTWSVLKLTLETASLAGATHVGVELLRVPAPYQELEEGLVDSFSVDLAVDPVGSGAPLEVRIPHACDALPFTPVYYVVLRARIEDSGVVLDEGPARILVFALDGVTGGNEHSIESATHWPNSAVSFVFVDTVNYPQCPQHGGLEGGVVPGGRVP